MAQNDRAGEYLNFVKTDFFPDSDSYSYSADKFVTVTVTVTVTTVTIQEFVAYTGKIVLI